MEMKTNLSVQHNQPFLKRQKEKKNKKHINQFLFPNKSFSFFQQGSVPPSQGLVSLGTGQLVSCQAAKENKPFLH